MHGLSLPLAALVAFTGGRADPPSPGGVYDGAAGQLSVETPAVEKAAIKVDGVLDEAGWQGAAVLRNFTQYEPVEGIPAFQPTEVMVLVDRSAIYFGVRAYDDRPGAIRATLTERDSFIRSDDYVQIILDTFNDQRRAYVFTVNPMGVQHDGIWNEGGSTGRRGGFGPPIDANPDFIWDSNARIQEWGYAVEIRIPFKSLRFPDRDVQEWGLQIVRKIQRAGFESSWAPITGNIANKLSQSGRLTNLRDLDPGLFMEFNPVVTGNRFGRYDTDLGRFVRDDPSGDVGMNFTYGITSNLTLDATYNPDFSQVEADAGQISVNERFALFFPEKRPFFLEGTEIFGMPKQLVYTRTIANPVGGVKLSGKVGSFNLGYIGAVDEGFDSGDPNTKVNLVRVRKDLGASSTLGAVYTDRTVSGDEYNRVAGADARLLFARRYTVTLMGAASRTRDPGDAGDPQVGRMFSAKVERAGRSFAFNAEIEDTDSEFRPGSGFFRRIGDTQLRSRVSYYWFGKRGSLLEQTGPSLELEGFWDHDDFWAGREVQEARAQLGWRFSFRNNITLFANYSRSRFAYTPLQYDGLYVGEGGDAYTPFRPDQSLFRGLDSRGLFLWFNNWQRVRGNARFNWSETPIFDRAFRVAVEPGRSFSGNLSLNLYPTDQLRGEIGLRHTRITRQDGAVYSTATIPRIRAQYQFSRSLFFRAIVEYSSQERGDLIDPVTGKPLYRCTDSGCFPRTGSDANDVHVEGLLTYEPSPGTVFYVGYTREMEDTEAFRFRQVRAVADGLFVKLSYRFRL
ncbi:MAG: DUF5916 domain-containing protein [Gemmatimonadota bacterium]